MGLASFYVVKGLPSPSLSWSRLNSHLIHQTSNVVKLTNCFFLVEGRKRKDSYTELEHTCPDLIHPVPAFLTLFFLSFEILSRLLHSAPLASPEEFFTPSPTKASQHPLAAVIKRAKQIEASNAEAKAKLLAQQQLQQLHQRAMAQVGKPIRIEVELHPQKPPQHAVQSASVSGNRTVIIGSSKLHCDPPPNDNKSRTNETAGKEEFDIPSVVSRSSTITSATALLEERKGPLVLRQQSYRTAVRSAGPPSKSFGRRKGQSYLTDPHTATAWLFLFSLSA